MFTVVVSPCRDWNQAEQRSALLGTVDWGLGKLGLRAVIFH